MTTQEIKVAKLRLLEIEKREVEIRNETKLLRSSGAMYTGFKRRDLEHERLELEREYVSLDTDITFN